MSNNIKLGNLLVEYNFITPEQLDEALKHQKEGKSEKKLGEIVVDMDFITEDQLIQILEFHLGIPHVDLKKYILDPQLTETLPENLARRYQAIPLELNGNTLRIALVDPSDVVAIDDIQRVTGHRVEPFIASAQSIKRALEELYIEESGADDVFRSLDEAHEEQEEEIQLEQLQKMVEDAPIVRLANLIINRAIQERSSDVHIEPRQKNVKVRYRLDGVLVEKMTVPKSSQAALVSRLKIMANLDIAERRKPQDGRVNLKKGDIEWDIRMSTLPTIFGEKVVIRLLDRQGIPNIEKLGFSDKNEKTFRRIIEHPYGIILVTGPTGSGKTTTLFSALKEVNKPDVNITTVEDPVEYVLPGINQIQANPRTGLTFASALRSILRQDPDVIMVGEIRDRETASIAVNAALTGHLVMSTLHTNDASTSISRLLDMGVEPFLIASTVVGVVAQRLVRRICPDCRKKVALKEEEIVFIHAQGSDFEHQYVGEGCKTCSKTGYKGRMALTEILIVDREIRRLIANSAGIDIIQEYAIKEGMKVLLQDGLDKVEQGHTTLEEVLRVATW